MRFDPRPPLAGVVVAVLYAPNWDAVDGVCRAWPAIPMGATGCVLDVAMEKPPGVTDGRPIALLPADAGAPLGAFCRPNETAPRPCVATIGCTCPAASGARSMAARCSAQAHA